MSDALSTKGTILKFSTNGGTASTALAEVKSLGINIAGASIDVSNFDSGEWNEYIAGRKDGSLTFSGNFIPDNTSHQAIHDTLLNANADYQLQFPPSGSVTFEFNGVLESLDIAGDDGDAFQMSCTIKLSGTPDWSATKWTA
jgi:predicted secreted protein